MENLFSHSFAKVRRLLAVAAIAVTCLTASASDYIDANGIAYDLDNIAYSATVTYKTTSYNSYSGNVTIPAQVTTGGITYAVTAVGDNAFRNCSGLTAITLGENIATVGNRAFMACSALQQVTITPAVTSLGDYAFADCKAMQKLILNNDAPLEVGNGTFMRCIALNTVNWLSCDNLEGRGGITSLGTSSFAGCTSLSTIMLPGNLTRLGNSIFDGCTNLVTIKMMNETPVAVTGNPFGISTSQATIYVPQGIEDGSVEARYKNALIWRDFSITSLPYSLRDASGYHYRKTSTTTVALTGCDIPGNQVIVRQAVTGYNNDTYNVTAIKPQAFKGTAIKSLDTSKALKLRNIGEEAFAQCQQLEQATIVEGVTEMGERAFAACTALKSVTVPSTLRTIPQEAFKGCTALTSVNMMHGVGYIATNAFAGCTSLIAINLPRSIVSVEPRAFAGATSLQAINVDPRCTHYTSIEGVLIALNQGEDVEEGEEGKMSALSIYPINKPDTHYYIPCGITSVSDCAFEDARNLLQLAIPATVNLLGDDCFKGSTIETYNWRAREPIQVSTNALSGIASTATVQVPVGAMTTYKATEGWSALTRYVERYDTYNDNSFAYDWDYDNNLTVIDIKTPAVSSDGELDFPSGVNLSGVDYIAAGLGNLSTTNVAQLVKTFNLNSDNFAYIDTSDGINPLATINTLEIITLNNTNPYFKLDDGVLTNSKGNRLYYYLRSKQDEHYTLNEAIDTITPQAFARNQHLQYLTCNTKLNFIDKMAFLDCSSLITIQGGEALSTIGSKAFANCQALTHMPLLLSVVNSVDDYAFKNCTSLKNEVFPSTLKHLGQGAFEGCTALKRVFFVSTINTLGDDAFKGCSAMQELWLCNTTPPAVATTTLENCGLLHGKIYVPASAINDYHTIAPWNLVPHINACQYIENRADVNNDNVVNVADVSMLYSVIFGEINPEFITNFDANRDGVVNVADVTTVYNVILRGYDSAALAYSFLNADSYSINQNMHLGTPQIIKAIDYSINQPVTTGFTGIIDNESVATAQTITSDGIALVEVTPLALGQCAIVLEVTNSDGTTHYRAYALKISE